jgi:hypothetical protein
MRHRFWTIAAVSAALAATAASAQDKRVYDLGPVVDITHVDVEPGQLDAYMENLNNLWRRSMEDAKRRGEVLDYGVYENMAKGKDAPDLILVTVFRNAGVFDTPLDELDRRTAAMQGSTAKANQATIARGKLRTITGNEMYRELTFKGK